MIYVIKKPKNPLMWKHTCCYCTTQWLYDQSEIRNHNGERSIECPNCHVFLQVAGDSRVSDTEVEAAKAMAHCEEFESCRKEEVKHDN